MKLKTKINIALLGIPIFVLIIGLIGLFGYENSDSSFQWFLLFLIITPFILTIFLNIFLSKWILIPIHQITQTIHSLNEESPPSGIMIESADELTTLFSALDHLKGNIHQVKDELQISHEIIENMSECVYLVSKDSHKIVYGNPQLEKMFGYTIDEVKGQKAQILNPFSTSEEGEKKELVEMIGTNEQWAGEVYNVKKDGTPFWSHVYVTSFTHSIHGNVWLVVHEDTNELKKTQAQLIQSVKLASLGEMSTGIAHELNQPLSVISLESELSLREIEMGDTQNLQPSLEKILEQVQRASIIIDHLRTIGRETSALSPVDIDINILIEDTFVLINEQLKMRSIVVQKSYADNLPKFRGHPNQLEQVLTSLLSNAKDAVEVCANKLIQIRTFQQDQSLIIEIEDNGIGIPENNLKRIFDPFFTTKEVGKGTGLGLSISYGIIQEHGGMLNVMSQVNKGSIFKIELPLSNSKPRRENYENFISG